MRTISGPGDSSLCVMGGGKSLERKQQCLSLHSTGHCFIVSQEFSLRGIEKNAMRKDVGYKV